MNKRLTAQHWIDFALATLAREGFDALKADVLARKLGVSRGSFYWHFADIGAFEKAVLARWREVAAEAVIAELDRDVTPVRRLRHLLERAFTANAALERAVRAWAITNESARAVVEAVDRRRLAYLQGLFAAAGFAEEAATARAQIAYWAYLGFAQSGRRMAPAQLRALLDELAALFAAGEGPRRARR
jgi:AcrR family transcriptional regulator